MISCRTSQMPGRSRGARVVCHVAEAKVQAGAGLIEVLVAVLILSVAFLGIAALQATSLAANNSAMARSMATIASYSILDAMRADLAGATGGNYNTSSVIKANACSASASSLAAAQTNQWCALLRDTLGEAATTTGNIDCKSNGDCTVTISFVEVRPGANNSTTQTVVTRAML